MVPAGYLPGSIISQFATKTAAIYCYLHVGKGVLVFDNLWILVGKQACTTAGQEDIQDGQEATGTGRGVIRLATNLQLW